MTKREMLLWQMEQLRATDRNRALSISTMAGELQAYALQKGWSREEMKTALLDGSKSATNLFDRAVLGYMLSHLEQYEWESGGAQACGDMA